MAMEAKGRLQRSNRNACGQSAWSKLLRSILGVWRLANGRLERPNNRWLWRQTAGLNALTTNACGQSAWSKLPRSILGVWRLASGRLERPNNRWLWRQTAGLNALTTNACGQSAWSKLPRSILGVWRLASGRLERPNNRWLWSAGSKLQRSVVGVWRQADKNKFHTCGGPRRRPCLGEGRGQRIYIVLQWNLERPPGFQTLIITHLERCFYRRSC